MLTVEGKTIGECWRQAVLRIIHDGRRTWDGDLQLRELLHVTLAIEHPDENDPMALRPSQLAMREWMRSNFEHVGRIKELRDSWSYAWRLHSFQGHDQLRWVVECLTKKPESKSVTITMLQAAGTEDYIPCVSLLDFKLRDGVLILTVTCRSLDFGQKALHNLCSLSHVARSVCEQLSCKTHRLHVLVISAHVYERDVASLVSDLEVSPFE
ncbi:MAG: hypothetical protein HXY34_00275 [Candidatus Thorarchaeota archaeon]|nr:hypothetical protein [Candidatus Thorarchaeota archaeon]